jgi:hypothetical protein
MKKIMQTSFGKLLAVAVFTIGAALAPMGMATVNAQECDISDGIQGGVNCVSAGDQADADLSEIFTTIVNVLLFVIGAISVIMLIIGGIRYTISAGDSGAVTAAKNTILYAIIGLIVAFLAFAIVNFVVGSFAG